MKIKKKEKNNKNRQKHIDMMRCRDGEEVHEKVFIFHLHLREMTIYSSKLSLNLAGMSPSYDA